MFRDPPYRLRALTSDSSPGSLMWLDCQPVSTKEVGVWVDRWSRGSLGTNHWTSRRGERRDAVTLFEDSRTMWAHAAERRPVDKRVVLFADDLACHLRISQALLHLPALCFELDKIVMERTSEPHLCCGRGDRQCAPADGMRTPWWNDWCDSRDDA